MSVKEYITKLQAERGSDFADVVAICAQGVAIMRAIADIPSGGDEAANIAYMMANHHSRACAMLAELCDIEPSDVMQAAGELLALADKEVGGADVLH